MSVDDATASLLEDGIRSSANYEFGFHSSYGYLSCCSSWLLANRIGSRCLRSGKTNQPANQCLRRDSIRIESFPGLNTIQRYSTIHRTYCIVVDSMHLYSTPFDNDRCTAMIRIVGHSDGCAALLILERAEEELSARTNATREPIHWNGMESSTVQSSPVLTVG